MYAQFKRDTIKTYNYDVLYIIKLVKNKMAMKTKPNLYIFQ